AEGVYTFTYTIADASNDQDTATVTVTVGTPASTLSTPTAVDDIYGENEGFDRYAWTSSDPVITLDVLTNDSFGSDGAMTAHNALNLINGKLDEFSAEGRRIRILDNGTPLDYSDDKIAYYATGNLSVTTDSFTYTITDNTGDAATATVTINYFDTPTPKPGDPNGDSTEDTLSVANEFSSYPNPSNGNLTTTVFSTQATKATLSLFDIKGMEVYRGQLDLKAGKNVIQNNFNVKAGVMFLRITSAKDNYGTKKVIFK
uniref:Ig-like domain-containing protein n=1 Tax=uncultured Polaribacter sp. TaxID=174711 RepID=UPI00260F8865